MTWKAYHNRGETLRAVIATAEVRRDGILPMDLDGVAQTFHDELDLLGALQLKWHTRLSGHIERLLMTQPMDLRSKVALGWKLTADEMYGVRMILDHYTSEPLDDDMARAMATATAKERYYLGVMAGRARLGDEGAGALIGAEIEHHGRNLHKGLATLVLPAADVDEEPKRLGLIERLRAVVAA